MVKFLTTKGIISEIENLIRKAKAEIVIISPYVQISEDYANRLQDAIAKGVNVKLVYGKSELNKSQVGILKTLKKLSLFFVEDLHAKCYYNENEMVISSMNLYTASEKNKEMGFLIERETEGGLFTEIMEEAEAIIKKGKEQDLAGVGGNAAAPPRESPRQDTPSPTSKAQRGTQKVPGAKPGPPPPANQAHCIRCDASIPLDPSHPYCKRCFSIWNRYGDPEYTESYCHACGIETTTSMDKPLCYACFRSLNGR